MWIEIFCTPHQSTSIDATTPQYNQVWVLFLESECGMWN
jgi:hypothetical protein